jgi:CheY-like chemotaxis protein
MELFLRAHGYRTQVAGGIQEALDVAKSKSAGFAAHLVKPIAPQVLEAVLVRAVEVISAKKSR